MPRLGWLKVACAVVGLGCGPESGASSGDGGAESTGSSDTGDVSGPGLSDSGDGGNDSTGMEQPPLPTACSCAEPSTNAFRCDDADLLACELPEPCPTVLSQCARANPDMYACMASEHAYDADAMTCVLDGLLAETPGVYTIERENTTCGLEGCGVERVRIALDATRVALELCDSDPVGPGDVEAGTTILDPAALEACAEQPDPDRLTCVLASLAMQAPVCN